MWELFGGNNIDYIMAFSVVGGLSGCEAGAQFSPVSLKSRVPMGGGREPRSMRYANKTQNTNTNISSAPVTIWRPISIAEQIQMYLLSPMSSGGRGEGLGVCLTQRKLKKPLKLI